MYPALVLFAAAVTANPGLQGVLDEMRVAGDLPGISAAVTLGGLEVFAGGSGMADLETGRPMTGDTVLYAGSLSKVFTSVLALQLVDEGRLLLDRVVPGIGRGNNEVRVSHLLTHASGLSREGNFGYWFTAEFPDRAALTRFLGVTTLQTPPGRTVNYSNIGFAALGLVVEEAAGQGYSAALRRRVLEPLGMADSGAPGPAEGIARGYTPPGRVIPNADRPFAGVGAAVGDRRLREYHDARAMTPAFGVYTTASDLGKLARFLLGHGGDEVLGPASRRRMLVPDRARRTLGLAAGTLDGRSVVSHSGWFAAHRSYLLLDLEAGIGVAVMANGDDARPEAVAEALLRRMIGPPGDTE